jgi:glucose-6-phosphate dehydrogenase assembly protein OpcA
VFQRILESGAASSLDLGKRRKALGDLDDVRTYGYKASRAAALIYAHFKKEFAMPHKR